MSKIKFRTEVYFVIPAKAGMTTINTSVYFLFLFLMVSCSSARYEVAPEPRPVIQQSQPLSFQEIKGQRTMAVASWYGPEFNGKPTSSGEYYNMYALTCAHKEYPFGTRLRVVNVKNGKEVECIVNDRGPFIPGRDLDLSYAAAKKIDLIGPGTASVMIEPVGRDLRYVRYVRYSGVLDSAVTIQIGSFREESSAKRQKMALELKYSKVYIMRANVGGATYYRVRVGRFRTKADAVAVGRALADEGYNVLITRFEQQI